MEPNQLRAGEKVAVPEAWKAQGNKEAARAALIGEWRRWLGSKQQEVLEENSLAPFTSRIPIEALKAFTPEEREELQGHEEAQYRRFAPLAEARHTQRLAYVQAGGTGRSSTRCGRPVAGR